MRTTVTLLLCTLLSAGARAQCSVSIPSSAIVFDQTSGFGNYTGQSVWICEDANLGASGNNNTFYMEGGGLTFTGNNNTIHSKLAIIYIGAGSQNTTIYHEGSGAFISDNGTGTMLVPCTTVTFNYANAPAAGCAGVGIEETDPSVAVQLLPNPVRDVLTITSDGNTIHGVQLTDLIGHVVRYQAGADVVLMDTGDLPSGVYLVHVHTSNGILVRRVVKQ